MADCAPCPVDSFCQSSADSEPCPLHTHSQAGSTSKLACLCDLGYVCTYTKAVRVNVTLPLTAAQFQMSEAQFLQAVAAAAGVDVSQVSIVGITPANPNSGGRRGLPARLTVAAHIDGAERLQGLRRELFMRGVSAYHARETPVVEVHAARSWLSVFMPFA